MDLLSALRYAFFLPLGRPSDNNLAVDPRVIDLRRGGYKMA